MGILGRLLLGTGELPAEIRGDLEIEGLVLAEEGLSGSLRYSKFRAPGKRIDGKIAPERMCIGVSEHRLVILCRSGRVELIDSAFSSPRVAAADVSLADESQMNIRIDYDQMADAESAGVSGQITIRLKSTRAPEMVAALHARLPGSWH